MKRFSVVIAIIFLAGCGGSLSNSWDNFTAYYNTYYNAKKDFRAGLKKVQEQQVQLDPALPVRPHPAPFNAGNAEFKEAINKGALVLRRHSDSKWTDNALLLIGKSYYYRQEFFQAIQTFEELIDLSSATTLKQQGILWKSRALLDVASYGEGISFLETQIDDLDTSWEPHLKAEAQILLAQHFAMLENWSQAAALLEPAILRLEDRALKGRSYFLLGQVFQWQGDLNRSFQSYSNVKRYYPDYEYIFWADVKRAEAARMMGNPELAVSIYRSMLNDDKNTDRRDNLNFELAQTYEQEGEVRQAEEIYQNILSSRVNRRSSLVADTYYQLGELYSREYNNYRIAAAYYDSSTSLADQLQQANSQDALRLASAYGDYVMLKSELSAADSLISLGKLPAGERESIIAEIRRQKRIELRDADQGTLQTDNILSNTTEEDTGSLTSAGTSSSTFGFLNYRNARMVQAARQQFTARWGSRPLVDNWRRTNAIQSTSNENQAVVPETPGTITDPQNGLTDEQLGIDVNAIPVTPEARREKRIERLNLQYRLGNLFFLTLNQPDSAVSYFNRVLADTIDSPVNPKAIYSLFRLYELEEQPDSAAKYREQILKAYPRSVYADRIQQGTGNENVAEDSAALLREKVQTLLAGQETEPPSIERAVQFKRLALDHRDSELAPYIFYQGIKEYIRAAKVADSSAVGSSYSETPNEILPDSAGTDTLVVIASEQNRIESWLKQFKSLFPAVPQTPQVNQWLDILSSAPDGAEILPTCRELDVTPSIQPDMQAFLERVQLPDNVRDMSLSGTLSYRIVINEQGRVKSFELLSNPTNLGIEPAYEKAMKESLQFEPVIMEGKPVSVSCEVTFPIKQ